MKTVIENMENLIEELGWWEHHVDDKKTGEAINYLVQSMMSIAQDVKHLARQCSQKVE